MEKRIIITIILLTSLFLTCNRDKKQLDKPISKDKINCIIKSDMESPVKLSLLIEIDKIKKDLSSYILNEDIVFFYIFFKQEEDIDYLHIVPDIQLPLERDYEAFEIIKENNVYIIFYTEIDNKYKEFVDTKFLSHNFKDLKEEFDNYPLDVFDPFFYKYQIIAPDSLLFLERYKN